MGDCLEVMAGLPDASFDMVFTDLPYGTTRNRWDTPLPLDALWEQYRRLLKDRGVAALWAQMPFAAVLAASNLPMFRYEWVVEKANATGFLNAKRMPMKCHEQVLVFYRKLPAYEPQMTHGHARKTAVRRHGTASPCYGAADGVSSYDSTDRYPRDVLKFRWDRQKGGTHPTQKPLEACEYFIRTYTRQGMAVLDSCMGSGTAGVACARLGRRFTGIELDPGWFRHAEERIREAEAEAGG